MIISNKCIGIEIASFPLSTKMQSQGNVFPLFMKFWGSPIILIKTGLLYNITISLQQASKSMNES